MCINLNEAKLLENRLLGQIPSNFGEYEIDSSDSLGWDEEEYRFSIVKNITEMLYILDDKDEEYDVLNSQSAYFIAEMNKAEKYLLIEIERIPGTCPTVYVTEFASLDESVEHLKDDIIIKNEVDNPIVLEEVLGKIEKCFKEGNDSKYTGNKITNIYNNIQGNNNCEIAVTSISENYTHEIKETCDVIRKIVIEELDERYSKQFSEIVKSIETLNKKDTPKLTRKICSFAKETIGNANNTVSLATNLFALIGILGNIM